MLLTNSVGNRNHCSILEIGVNDFTNIPLCLMIHSIYAHVKKEILHLKIRSYELVASSRMTICLFLSRTLAIQRSCRCPLESEASSRTVSSLSGRDETASLIPTRCSDAQRASSVQIRAGSKLSLKGACQRKGS